MRIRISWDGGSITGVLNDSDTAKQLPDALPYTATAKTWGKEVYFDLPLKTDLAPDSAAVVAPGTICFWVQGQCLALPYGATPSSDGEECRLVTAVNIIGKLDGDPNALAAIPEGASITTSLDEGN
jgi:hypothetical protein